MKYNHADFSFECKTEPFIFDLDSLFYHLDCLTDGRKPKGVRYPLSVALCEEPGRGREALNLILRR